MAKIVIIGAGHNGLVAACYLAKAGHKVKVFEKRKELGGCCVTDDRTFPQFKISSAAYVNSLFLPEIVEDLRLKDYGYEVLSRDPVSFTPLPDGRYLFLGRDKEFNYREISKFSVRDAENYLRYEAVLDKIAAFISSVLTTTPPQLPPRTFSDCKKWCCLLWRFLKLRASGWEQMIKIFSTDAVSFLDSWFESDALKATLLTDAAIGAVDLCGYVLLHHCMGEAGGARGVWGYQKGGMGGLTKALAQAARGLGVIVYRRWGVEEIIISDGKAGGVVLEGGVPVEADVVVSNADPKRTCKLLPVDIRTYDVQTFRDRIEKLDFSSASMKVNLILSKLPDFLCLPGNTPGPQHRGTIHIGPSVEYILKAAEEGKKGIPSRQPVLEVTIPSVVDETLAPRGRHVMNIFVQYAPYHLQNSQSWDKIKEPYFYENILPALERYAPGIRSSILGYRILSPLDLEREFGLTEGNIFHGAMHLGQLFSFRPLRGWCDYRTPVKNLYLCGAGTHPGGGVIGANGLNAAREVLKDLRCL